MDANQAYDRGGASRMLVVTLAGVFVVAVGGALWASKLLGSGADEAELEARRERIAAMTDAEKDQLRIKQERFAKLDEAERKKLRALHAAIQDHPRSDDLERVMIRYRQWLRELTPEDRASLLTTDFAERLAVVESLQEKLRQRYLAEAGKEMSKEDADAVRKWMDEFAMSRVPQALEAANEWEKEGLEKAIQREDDDFQRQIVWQMIFRRKIPPPSDDDHRKLADSVSPKERERYYDGTKTEDERARVVNAWIMGSMPFRRGWGNPSHEDLQKELEKLPPDERKKISTLPPEMMREALKRKWMESRMTRGRGRPGGRGDRGSGERRPGDRRPGDRGSNRSEHDRGRDDHDADRRRESKPDEKPADQSGDQSSERPDEGAAAVVRRALMRTYGAA